MLKSAINASERAYAPYSRFNVGASIQIENGQIVNGNNQENNSYPAGSCAERVALNYAKSQFPDLKIIAVAIYASTEKFELDQPVSPCGICRQVLLEAEINQSNDIKLIMGSPGAEIYQIDRISDLLPFAFNLVDLKN